MTGALRGPLVLSSCRTCWPLAVITPRGHSSEKLSPQQEAGVAWQPLRPPPLPWLNSQKAHQEVGGLSTTSSPQVRNWRPGQTEHLETERRGLGPVRRRRRLSLPPRVGPRLCRGSKWGSPGAPPCLSCPDPVQCLALSCICQVCAWSLGAGTPLRTPTSILACRGPPRPG